MASHTLQHISNCCTTVVLNGVHLDGHVIEGRGNKMQRSENF